MIRNSKLVTMMTVVLSLDSVSYALAQSAISAPAQKTIGSAKAEMVPSLIVMNAKSATIQGQTLTLSGVSPNSIVFADRPVRAAGHALTSHLLEEWASGSDSFAKDPPNATISALGADGATVNDAVVTLRSPKMEGDRLTFDISVLEGDLKGATGPASVFIVIIGMPLTPLSYAGAARRTARRAAWYGAGAAAVAAAPYYGAYAPYGAYYGPPAYTHPYYRPY